ncbi:LuxR C-terminal-related transcriptional regulator [Streptomyces cyaneofuscatus]|uniref:LuxR C-terminal-related transcriptional regulator n=1 Tax=Streptomyces cyaneofuscatus TaxID=66883 RepID=UPI0036294F70
MRGPVSRLPRPAGRTPAGRGYEKLCWTRGSAIRVFGDSSFLDSLLLRRRRHRVADRRIVLAGPLLPPRRAPPLRDRHPAALRISGLVCCQVLFQMARWAAMASIGCPGRVPTVWPSAVPARHDGSGTALPPPPRDHPEHFRAGGGGIPAERSSAGLAACGDGQEGGAPAPAPTATPTAREERSDPARRLTLISASERPSRQPIRSITPPAHRNDTTGTEQRSCRRERGEWGSVLWERDEVLGTATAAGEAARAGNGRWIRVTGALPGMGRTALLDEVVRRQTADGMRVKHARGAPEEAAFPYGLVRRLLTDIGGVPFGTPTGHSEQWLYHRLVTQLARLATERPVLLAVDDLHHADEPSRHWIGYLARRIAELPVLLVTTTCEGYTDPPALAADTGTSAELRPLSAPAVVRIARAAGLSTQETTTCIEAGAGNPALVRALVADLRDGPSSRSSLAPERSRYRETITGWIRGLPDPRSRHACLALAVAAGGETASGLSDRDTGLCPARPAPGSPSMGHRLGTLLRHPLAREAVLAAAEPEELAVLHTRVAQVLAEEGAPATAVAARLLYVDRPGEAWMVRSLEEAADETLRAGRPDESAGYLRHALSGPLAPDRRAGLAMRLGALELPGNVTAGIRWLYTGLELHTDLRERASAASALSAGLVAGRDPDAALRILRQVGRAADNDDELVHVLQALGALVSSHEAEAWRDAVSALRALAPVAPPTIEPLVCGLITEYEAGAGLCSAAEAVARVERRLEAPVDQRLRTAWLGSAATLLQWADRLEEARALAARCLPSSPIPPDLTDMGLQCLLSVRAEAALWAGEFGRVIDENVAWVELSAGQGVRLPHLAAMVALARSEIGARAEAWEAVTVTEPSGADTSWEWNELGYARARLHEADGDWRAALEGHLACGAGQSARDFVSPVATPWRSGAAFALARLGRREEARELAEEELRHARLWGTGRTIGRALRAQAAALGGRLALESLTEAAELLGSAPAPVELVETLVDLGRARLDAGNGRKGRDTLREAHAVALRLAAQKSGARRLLDLTEEALRRGGARKTNNGQALTAAERRVAELAAAGHTNARISSSLCLTRRTVEMHLTNAYRKLRIARRTQLVAVLAREAGPVNE